MPKLAADLGSLWPELPYLDRFDAAQAAGFDGVVVPFPYERPAKETQRALQVNGTKLVCVAAPPPNYTGGIRGFAAVPGLEMRFQNDLRRALRYCTALKVPMLRILAGDAKGKDARNVLVENLSRAVETLPDGVILLLGPELRDRAFLTSHQQVAEVVGDVDSPALKIQFDCLASAEAGEEPVETAISLAPTIGHVQVYDTSAGGGAKTADDLHAGLRMALTEADYAGWVAVGLAPTGAGDPRLDWIDKWRS